MYDLCVFRRPRLYNKHNDFYSQGKYWIVKSDTVSIQARYLPTPITHGLSVTKEVAISGPFLKGHELRISARAAIMGHIIHMCLG